MMQARQMPTETKLQVVCTLLTELAVQKEAHERLPTVRELCELLTTSRTTLDDALSLLEQQHVIYRRQGSGIFVSPRLHHKSICILLDSAFLAASGASPFWGILWGLFARESPRRAQLKDEYHSFHMVVESEHAESPLPEDVMTMIRAGRVHGLVVVGLKNATGMWLEQQGVPSVAFAAPHRHMVMLDNTALLEMAVARLVEQGCQKIALWSTSDCLHMPEKPSSWHENVLFQNTLTKHGLAFRPTLVRDYLTPPLSPGHSLPLSYQEQGYLVAMDVFGDPEVSKPDGIVIMDDMMTDGVLAALQVLRIRPGDDVKIVTHGNVGSMMSLGYMEGVTVIEFDPAEIVHEMFTMLDLLLAGQAPDELKVYVKPRFRQPRW